MGNKGTPDGPIDGATLASECINTVFLGNPGKSGCEFKQSKNEARISASFLVGTFSIRDVNTGLMLSISLKDAVDVINESMRKGKATGNVLQNPS